jgi:polyphosphate glucokinase
MVVRASRAKRLNTLSIDVGGTGIKASVLDPDGKMECDRVRVETPYPLSPQKLVLEIQRLISELPSFDRVSVGFPGMVRDDQILSAPHFISPSGPSGRPEPKLIRAWSRFDLAAALEEVTGRPTKVANDADLQGAAVIDGKGFEAVVTLGTGVGTAFFLDGILLPHFEFSHTPLSKSGNYNDVLGEAARKKIGNKKWEKRVRRAIEVLRALTFFDRCFIGGGNSSRLGPDLPEGVTIVDNTAGILGGIKLWERTEAMAYARAAARKGPVRSRPAAKKAASGTRKKAAPRTSRAPARARHQTGPEAPTVPSGPLPEAELAAASAPAPRSPAGPTGGVEVSTPIEPAGVRPSIAGEPSGEVDAAPPPRAAGEIEPPRPAQSAGEGTVDPDLGR